MMLSTLFVVLLLALTTNAEEEKKECPKVYDRSYCYKTTSDVECWPKEMYEYTESEGVKVIYYCQKGLMWGEIAPNTNQYENIGDTLECGEEKFMYWSGKPKKERKKVEWLYCELSECKLTPPKPDLCYPADDCTEANINDAKNGLSCTKQQNHFLQISYGANIWSAIRSKELACAKNSIAMNGMGNPLVRCRKERQCNEKMHFVQDGTCPAKFICEEPNVKETDLRFTCGHKKMEVKIGNDGWSLAKTAKCSDEPQKGWYNGELENGDKFVEYSPLLRCTRKVCDATRVLQTITDKSCLSPTPDCGQIWISDYGISCTNGYNLEGHNSVSGIWRYFDSKPVECDGLTIIPNEVDNYKEYDTYRCWKPRSCEIDALFDASKCESSLHCKTAVLKEGSTTDYHCLKGYQLQFNPLGSSNREDADKLTCDSNSGNNRLIIVKADKPSAVIPEHIRCSKKKHCELDLFFNPRNCDSDAECFMPKFVQIEESDKKKDEDLYRHTSSAKHLICQPDFGLQAELTTQSWVDISGICLNEETLLLHSTSQKLTEIPLALRCVRKKINDFYDAKCESDKVCGKPEDKCDPIECANNYGLQMKIDGEWKAVKSARCSSNVFNIMHTNNMSEILKDNVRTRCVQMKCTQCENPCPNCVESAFTFTKSTKWDQCSEFKCGRNTQTSMKTAGVEVELYDEETVIKCSAAGNKWTTDGSTVGAESIDCEYFCTAESKITSDCKDYGSHCNVFNLKDTETMNECTSMYYEPNVETPRIEIADLKCNRNNGSWLANKMDSSTVVVPEGSNVYCYEVGDCEVSKHLPSCEQDEDCKKYNVDGHKFRCDESYVFWSREVDSDKWKKMSGVNELECRAGQIIANEHPVSYSFQAMCRLENKPVLEKAGSKIALYVCMTLLILILIVIILATIILRVTGHGWLHSIIIDKARGTNGNMVASRAYSASSIDSGKSPSNYSPGTIPSQKSTKRTQRKVEPKSLKAPRSARPSSSHASYAGATSDSIKSKKASPVKGTVFVI